MVFTMLYTYTISLKNQNLIIESTEIVSASNYLQDGSDKLSKNIWLFISTKDEKFAKRFLDEAFETKTREKGFEILYAHSFDINYDKLEVTKKLSDDLLLKELWLMRLVYESKNTISMPKAVAEVQLTEAELEMTSQQKYDTARNYILLGEYDNLKSKIDSKLSDFNQDLNKMMQDKITKTNQINYYVLLCKYTLLTLFILWCIAILIVLNIKIIRPILGYVKVYQNFDIETQNTVLVEPKGMKEVFILGEAYNKATAILGEMRTSLEAKNKELNIQKNNDPLTGVYNRGFFETKAWEKIANKNYTIFCVDVNNFKEINDTNGHTAGDEILKFIVKNLQSVIRSSDTIVRMGGDEFVLIAHEMVEPEMIDQVSKRLAGLQGKELAFENVSIPTYFSFGVATHFENENSFDAIFKLADERMYANKKHHKSSLS